MFGLMSVVYLYFCTVPGIYNNVSGGGKKCQMRPTSGPAGPSVNLFRKKQEKVMATIIEENGPSTRVCICHVFV